LLLLAPSRRPLDLSKSLRDCGVVGNTIIEVERVAGGGKSVGVCGGAVKIALSVLPGGRRLVVDGLSSSLTLLQMLEAFAEAQPGAL